MTMMGGIINVFLCVWEADFRGMLSSSATANILYLIMIFRFILSLSTADLSLSLFVMVPYILNHKQWTWGVTLCKVWGTADVILCSASVYSLVGISIDRFFAVFFPIR